MDRETRKANLKKLQLPGTSDNIQRKTRQTTRSKTTSNSAISNYFLTPEKQNRNLENLKQADKIVCEDNSEQKQFKIQHSPEENKSNAAGARAKRTKLDAFIFKDPKKVPNSIKKTRKTLNDDDLMVPEVKIKKAPQLSQRKKKSSASSRAKKQTTIKTAFLRNEQLFAEIAAQHCAAEQFDGDDVQLALAISKSEAESKSIQIGQTNINNNVMNVDDEAESIREKLKNYGFRTAEKKDYNTFAAAFLPKINSRRPKSKWANKFTALTLRSSENQQKKLQENVEKLLNIQFRSKPLKEQEPVLPTYRLQSSMLKNCELHANKRILQNVANLNRPIDLYFVKELVEINKLPAGHLLKDWCAIQGRDLTPNPKDKQNIERLQILETIYQDLQEYFSSSKRLDWTGMNQDQEVVAIKNISTQNKSSLTKENSSSNSPKMAKATENEELNGMIELIENLQRKGECGDSEISKKDTTTSIWDNKILQLLPTCKSLDTMQVSSCSINSQATNNTTWKNRPNSPDLFADSDVEMEDVNANNKTKTATNIDIKENHNKETYSNTSTNDITTYEVFSSDEVKKTSLLELNESLEKDLLPKSALASAATDAIDLTQDDLLLSNCSKHKSMDALLNESKPIVEIDLFAESPLQDENSNVDNSDSNVQQPHFSQAGQTEKMNFKLSLAEHEKERLHFEKEAEEFSKFSPRIETKKLLTASHKYLDDEDISSLNFEDSKQLVTSFHKETASFENDIIKYNLSGNDTIFRELCNKYLNREAHAHPSPIIEQENHNLNKISPKTSSQCDNFTNFTMDFGMTDDINLPFTTKTKNHLPKSQTINDLNLNIRIDLTQNDDANSNSDGEPPLVEEEDDDDCLVLSNDEINYSIWQANKTLNLQTSKHNHQQEIDNISISSDISSCEEDYKIFHQENIIEFPYNKKLEQEFSYLDLEEKEKSLIKIHLGPEETTSDFEILTSKYATSNAAEHKEMQSDSDRSECGTLENYCEPISCATNLCSPTKVLAEASFLCSPSETAAPMKLYSHCHKSSQKFQNLLNNVQTVVSPPKAVPEFEDFDEFDLLLSKSPLKTRNSPKKPQGIEQLLTAPIRCKEIEETGVTSDYQEVKYNNKTYRVRYTNSPKPDYTAYSEADLLKELYNYGIKPLKRKQAVKMLEYIYNQTHPILTDELADTNLLPNHQDDAETLNDFELPCTSKEALNINRSTTKSDDINSMTLLNNGPKEIAASPTRAEGRILNLQDSCGREMLRYSNDLKAELQDEIYILQTNVTKKTAQPLLPFHIAWYNLVCSNRNLHETILMYEPIDLQEIYTFFKSLGYRYDPKDLKTFFDRRCIIFRYDLANAGAAGNMKFKNTNRHVRKSKKTKI